MKFYIKLFVISLVGFAVIFWGGWHLFVKSAEIDQDKTVFPSFEPEFTLPNETDEEEDEDKTIEEVKEEIVNKTELDILLDTSDRVNFLVFAHDGVRADTIMFVSFDKKNQFLDIVNIPRDTFWLVEGYEERTDHKKINAVFGHAGEKGGSLGLKQEITNMMGVPVNYYVKFNYNGAAAVVDTLGGIEISVPFDMLYDDVWADPELHINIPAGQQLLDGKNAVDYLRWRQNNDGLIKEGDLQRIERMQSFLKLALKKSMSLKLPSVISTGIKYVQTDIAANLAISLADDAIGMSSENISTYRLPGEVPDSVNLKGFYVSNPGDIKDLMIDIYSKGKN